MSVYITESWLRERFSMADGTEVHLPADCRLTPSAASLIQEHHVQVKYIDDAGRIFVAETPNSDEDEAPDLKRVHPLTSADSYEKPHCLLCQQAVEKKPEALTHLDGHTLVPKNDPRIRFRGLLDSTIAQAIWVQACFQQEGKSKQIQQWLADVRSALGNVLQAEATSAPLPPLHMGDLDDASIHAISHNPLKYLGHDHIVPEVGHGMACAQLNLLRGRIREAECAAADIFITSDFKVLRPDIMQGINRLSSAVYVLMLMVYVAERKGEQL